MADIMCCVTYNFNVGTDNNDEDRCETIEELKDRMKYSVQYLEKAEKVLRCILNDRQCDTTLRDFELGK